MQERIGQDTEHFTSEVLGADAQKDIALAHQIVGKFEGWAKKYGQKTAYGVGVGIAAYGVATFAIHTLREAGVGDILSEITMDHLTKAEDDLKSLSRKGRERTRDLGTKVKNRFIH
ncbi:MAG: hypothetical protein Q8P25_02890 [Candidatus Curtissbacteria bacterium]|nr:hypothetical protein [Candidatus Curtissbacteria bacterium]